MDIIMTQSDQTNPSTDNQQSPSIPFRSTRHDNFPPDPFDPNQPRLGRRESEPHSMEITHIYDVLTANFPKDRVMWDLHHYLIFEGQEVDLQFDISLFRDFSIPYTLSSYRAKNFGNKVPTLAINVLSKSTWRADLSDIAEFAKGLKIPVFIVYGAYNVTTTVFKPPFVRAYIMQAEGTYIPKEIRLIGGKEGKEFNPPDESIIDLSPHVPFRITLIERKQKHEGELPTYQLELLETNKKVKLKTQLEMTQEKVAEEKARADAEKARADAEKTRADAEKTRADALEAEIKQMKMKIQ
jgi:hypothetical protein